MSIYTFFSRIIDNIIF